MMLRFKWDDGGRGNAGFKGDTGDCVTRAICIATGDRYRFVYNALTELTRLMSGGIKRSVRDGASTPVYYKYLTDGGWELARCKDCYLTSSALPMGEVIAVLPRHIVAVLDHVVLDTWDSRKSNRTKCGAPPLLGYYSL